MKHSILRLEETTFCQGDLRQCRTVFKTRHGRTLYLALELSGGGCSVVECFYTDRGQGCPKRLLEPKMLKTRRFPPDKLLEVISSELDKTFYGVEYIQNDTAGLSLEEYLQRKADEANRKYRFLILVGEGERVNGLPI